jgi:protein-S-isoprenylcysteine O-methyltransferase Ste14
VLAALLVAPTIARIRAEEWLLASAFGAEYEAYRARTRSKLLPGFY